MQQNIIIWAKVDLGAGLLIKSQVKLHVTVVKKHFQTWHLIGRTATNQSETMLENPC